MESSEPMFKSLSIFPFMGALHVTFAYVVMPNDDIEHHLLAT